MNIYELISNDPAIKALSSGSSNLFIDERTQALTLWASFRQKPRNMVVVKNNLYNAQQLASRLSPLLGDDLLLFGVEENLRVEAVAASPTMYAQQMETLTRLFMEDKPHVIVVNPMSLIRMLPDKEVFKKHISHLKVGQRVDFDNFKKILTNAGYRYSIRVDQPLTYCYRGDIIDVFSIQYDNPIRIEFFDDEIDSIRFFDVTTQRTINVRDEVTIVPASCLIYDEQFEEVEKRIRLQLKKDLKKVFNPDLLEETVNTDIEYLRKHLFEHKLYRYYSFFEKTTDFLSYIDNPQVLFFNNELIEDNVNDINKDSYEYVSELNENSEWLNYYSLFMDLDRVVSGHKLVKINEGFENNQSIHSKIKPVILPGLMVSELVNQLTNLAKQYKIYINIDESRKQLLEMAFNNVNLNYQNYYQYIDDNFTEGFSYDDLMFLTDNELFGKVKIKKRFENKFKGAEQLEDYRDLQVGDYVVHSAYGIGQYQGIINKVIRGTHRDYLDIRYKDDDQLLVPLEQFKLVRKYLAVSENVRLSSLHSSAWKKAREKVEKDVKQIAERLIDLYASREENIGYAFSPDNEAMAEFENEFEFELTADQVKAIADVKKDMESSKPMDRLLCGDVGFGKTEVAMVAAFKAINDLKQVAYLCPTTILARQHYYTFKERFKNFPVKIALLNRFVTVSEQKRIIKEVKEGKIDILIGTHRILSNDIKFEDLGLLIVDEEQRFGVEAKEKIKEIKKSIDVLSLSATPIPRTLQLSLVGVMSLSQLDSPPVNRIPIQTYVIEKDDSIIKKVCERELSRNGQIFILHNNTETIYGRANQLQKMLPYAKIGVGHGKMSRDDLEDVMYRFINGEYDILLCTTIVETGIDIPNANTMIIENAHLFGLSQLYQIRGRVGRSDRVAYAYFMIPAQKSLSEVQVKRLQAIKDFTELGSGYKIAMRDLTIRGAGDLLGANQSGFMNEVGMDLYLELLQKAIAERKGLPIEENTKQPVHSFSGIDGYIPEKFTEHDFEKLSLYQRIDKVKNLSQLANLNEEITDRFGKLPAEVKLLFEKKQLEVMMDLPYILKSEDYEKECRITLNSQFSANVDGRKLFKQVSELSRNIVLKYNGKEQQIILSVAKKGRWSDTVNKLLLIIKQLGEENEIR